MTPLIMTYDKFGIIQKQHTDYFDHPLEIAELFNADWHCPLGLMNCKELMTSRSERFPYNLTSGRRFNRKQFGLSFGLKNRLRFCFDTETSV